MNPLINKKILGFLTVLFIMTSATLVFAHPSHSQRLRDPWVNTRLEARFDRNHDGWIEARERFHLHRYCGSMNSRCHCRF